MKVLHITPAFHPAAHWGGFTQSVPGLCNVLARIPEIELRVVTTDSDGPKRRGRVLVPAFPTRFPAGYDVYYCRRLWRQSVSLGLMFRLWAMIRWADVVHLTATYSFPTIPTLLVCRLLGKPVVWSPRGALQRWPGTSQARAKRVWESVCNMLCERRRVVLHLTSKQEREESRARIPNADTTVVPNGIYVPTTNGANKPSSHSELRLLYLGRLHPKKGIENLLHAVARVGNDVNLSICGDGESGYRRSLQKLASELSLDSRVKFCGTINEEQKARQFREADLCVVPSFTENFCLVVAESLAHGVPVIASTGTPWERVDEVGCGKYVASTPNDLAAAIEELRYMPLSEMGRKGREWMEHEFAWEVIAPRMIATYRELIDRNAT